MRYKKYKLGKTTRVYIPEVLKDKILELCRELDNHRDSYSTSSGDVRIKPNANEMIDLFIYIIKYLN